MMGRRKELKGIASGLISSFVSRNNDVYGYWGIGKLYSHMLLSNTLRVKIDLLKKEMFPYSGELFHLLEEYSKRIFKLMESSALRADILKSAVIIVTASPNAKTPSFRNMSSNKMSCELIIEDDLNRRYMGLAEVWCREHDPKIELKSTRVYKD